MNINKCNFQFLSGYNISELRSAFNKRLQKWKNDSSVLRKANPSRNIEIMSYFDDDKDIYKVAILGRFGDIIKKELYSLDEVLCLVHDNL